MRARRGQSTIYDALRIETAHDGAWKSPSMQDERAPAGNSFYAAMDSSGIGQADTSSDTAGRTYFGGFLPSPQRFAVPASFNSPQDVNKAPVENARAALPGRGVQPLRRTNTRRSPLARRS